MTAKPLPIRLYLALSAMAPPIWALALRWRMRMGKEDPARQAEKWGHAALPRPKGRLVWLHGVSVGETMVLMTLLARLSAAHPDTHFLLTSGTVASARALAQRDLPPRVIHQFAPIDCPGPVRRFLDHWRPDLFVLSEMDLWPQLVSQTHARGIPMLMLNAHVTPGRLQRRRRMARITSWLMERFDEIHVQDAHSRALFASLGAPADRMQVTGLLKGASDPPADQPEKRAPLAAQIKARPRWLAASTSAAEEPQIIAAQAQALRECPDLLLIIAPRQMAQADATEAAARAAFAQARIARRSRDEPITPETCLYIADTLGEMGLWYRLVPVAYTGQSLPVEHARPGGKNPFEAASLGVMILHGPHVDDFREAYAQLGASGGALAVADATALGRAVVQAQEPGFRAPYVAGAAHVRTGMMAPLERALASISRHLPAPPGQSGMKAP